MRMPFGKFRGRAVEEVPSSYLCWCLENCEGLLPRLEVYIRRELSLRFGGGGPSPRHQQHQRQAAPQRTRDAVNGWFRRLALRFHPDRGGSDEAMKVLNVARDELEAALLPAES